MKRFYKYGILVVAILAPLAFEAQIDSVSNPVTISGKVRDEFDQPVNNVIIINKRTRTGSFGKADGSFSITCDKNDTLAITSLGYHSRNVTYRDSAYKPSYNLVLYLETRVYRLPDIEVFAPRDLEKIQDDINKLGYDESDYMLSGINAMQSPITFLYQQFSKKERSKRLVAQMENEDMKRELLKELFHHYVDYDIIQLDDKEFDAFIDYLNVSDDFLRSSTQYDFLIYVRDRFKDYKIIKRNQNILNDSDYDYDKD